MSATLSDLNLGGALRQMPQETADLPPVTVHVTASGPGASVDKNTGAVSVPDGDGGVVISFNTRAVPKESKNFNDNLAELIDDMELSRISSELLTGIEQDDRSRQDWLDTRARGMEMLGTKLEAPRAQSAGESAPMEGMSTVRHPMLLESCLRFQANARGEMLPTDGPVKVKNWDDSGENDELADALEKDFNKYLTTTASEYYPDTDEMLFWVGFGGSGYKKGYNCPIRRRPVLESINAADVIVMEGATDLRNAPRVTHRIKMRTSMVKRMQIAEMYRDVPLSPPNEMVNSTEMMAADLEGVSALPTMPQDQEHTIYECYCELDVVGFEHKAKGKATGLHVPYKVTIDKDSMQVLEVRRNWDQDDPMCMRKMPMIRWPFVPFGLYGIGLVHILGNLTNALTAALREVLDCGMYANFPGALISKGGARQTTNNIRVPPGGLAQVETNGLKISDYVMPLPYKDITPGMMQLLEHIEEAGQRLGGTAELQVGEGRADVPVGTMLATIEQATKVLDAVHKRLHSAQAEEFQLLKELFREDPEAFWRFNKRPAMPWDKAKFLAALDQCDLVPYADPNTPSHMHRLMKATALLQLAQTAPQYFDVPAVIERAMKMAGMADIESLMKPPGTEAPPPPNPAVIAAQNKLQVAQLAMQKSASDNQAKAAMAQQENQTQIATENQRTQLANAKMALDAQRLQLDRQTAAQAAQVDVHDKVASHLVDLHQGYVDSAHKSADRAQQAGLAMSDQQHEAMLAAAKITHEKQQAELAARTAAAKPKPKGKTK